MAKNLKSKDAAVILKEQKLVIGGMQMLIESQKEIIRLHQDMLRDATNLEDLKGYLLNGPMYPIEPCPACEFLGKEKILEDWTDIYVHRDPEFNHVTILMQYGPHPELNLTFGEEFFKNISESDIKNESSLFQVAYEYYKLAKE